MNGGLLVDAIGGSTRSEPEPVTTRAEGAAQGQARGGSAAEGPTFRARELRRLLDTVSPEAAVGPGAEMPNAVLQRLAELIPCAGIGFIETDPHGRGLGPRQFIPFAANLHAEDIDLGELFRRFHRDGAPCTEPQNVVPVTVWQEFSRRDDGEHARGARCRDALCYGLLVRLPKPDGVERWIMLVRRVRDDPFGEADRLMLSLLQPHLAAVRDRVEALRSAVPALTARQVQLLRHVARGETNRQIGRHLGVTESTVRTHLEHIYARLNAHSRTEALAVAAPVLRT